jgi:hypothetical protein
MTQTPTAAIIAEREAVAAGHCTCGRELMKIGVTPACSRCGQLPRYCGCPDPDPWTDGTPNEHGLVWAGFARGWLAPEAL